MLLNRNGTAPPISMPMNTYGSATVSLAAAFVELGRGQLVDASPRCRWP